MLNYTVHTESVTVWASNHKQSAKSFSFSFTQVMTRTLLGVIAIAGVVFVTYDVNFMKKSYRNAIYLLVGYF